MRPRSPALSRFLGLWTAGWLAVLLVWGIVRFGAPAVQWPVLLVPALWALAALRPRRGARAREDPRRRPRPRRQADRDARPDDEDPPTPPPGMRTDTVERPALRRPQHPREDDRW